ncbi:hypothetical protein PEKONANI_01983 [Aeromonas jandaei]
MCRGRKVGGKTDRKKNRKKGGYAASASGSSPFF